MFGGLLPEGDGRETLARRFGISAANDHALLEALPQRPLAAEPGEGIRLSLAGAQAKLPIIVGDDGTLALPVNAAAPTTHIIKPEPAAFPGLVDNEAFCMDLARAPELPVASTRPREGPASASRWSSCVAARPSPPRSCRGSGRRSSSTGPSATAMRTARTSPCSTTRAPRPSPWAANAARSLVATGEHDNPVAREIAERVVALSGR